MMHVKSLMGKYEVSYAKPESLNDLTNRWNSCRIKYISIDPYIWFNEIYNINLKFKKIKAKYEQYDDKLKSHFFDVLPE